MRIGFTCGAFDLLHAGHVVMLEEAKNNFEKVINLCAKNKNRNY